MWNNKLKQYQLMIHQNVISLEQIYGKWIDNVNKMDIYEKLSNN